MPAASEASTWLRPVLDLIERFVAAGEVDGAALAVAVGGESIGEWYRGMAAPGLPAGPDVLWPLASLSKLYTAAAVLALVERGTLTLTIPVADVLPVFTGDGREAVRLAHLLTHTSGLIYESPRMEDLLARQTPLDVIVDEAYTHPLQFPPGTRISYSDYGYAIAGRLAAAAAGVLFTDLVRSSVLEPGGLTATFMPPPPSVYPRLAHVAGSLAYGTDGAMYNSPYARSLAHPAFGTVASVRDLLHFGLLFAPHPPHRILSEAAVRVMTTDQTGGCLMANVVGMEATLPQPWGMGFIVRGAGDQFGFFGDLTPPHSYGHAGASGCALVIDPADDITIAFVSNRHIRAGLERFRFRLSSVVNGVVAALTRRIGTAV